MTRIEMFNWAYRSYVEIFPNYPKETLEEMADRLVHTMYVRTYHSMTLSELNSRGKRFIAALQVLE